jgi:hypothetical protein
MSGITAYNLLDEQSNALAEAHLMDEGSTRRIYELGQRGELAEAGAAHIVQESLAMRRRYHSELENASQHIFENNKNSLKLRRNIFVKMDYSFVKHVHNMSMKGRWRTRKKWNY